MISNPTKVIVGAVGAVGVITTIALLHPTSIVFYEILGGAIVVILLLLLAYRALLKWVAARKAMPFSQTVTRAAGSTPNSISAVANRAKLDDLRRNFESGVAKFNAAGKDLYRLPWYLIIGEPGSGKTEAIRHSGIAFPPGLHDQLQGAGGTVNMNWWFTNDAVILDTAGRYLFDEIQPGASGEWTEFLSLLAQNRPQCPINGLLLVIPANSLILDTADIIQAKAGRIAQQLDRIQRTLDVRFPVFVVVTKCDLINGFREFFDGLNDQRQQGQILGWSNPEPLDKPFNSELVDEHLKTVHSRLMQRRLGLLIDPVARDAADAKRIDEVDALYSLPDSFLRIAPRLRQYLDMVFVAGEWSPKPLFLRGIYFTSSMREGQALDAELAELLGVPIDSLNESRMWDRDRAFFLRDLFVKKVFPEKGLVTRAASTRSVERHRKVALLGAGFAGTFALLGFTWVGREQLDKSVRQQADELQKLQDVDFSILARDPGSKLPVYKSRLDDPVGDGTKRVGAALADLQHELVDEPVRIPTILKMAAGIIDQGVNRKTLNDDKHETFRLIYAGSVLKPLAEAVDKRLEADKAANTWSRSSTDALKELIHLRTAQSPDLAAMFTYAVNNESAADAFRKNYAGKLSTGLQWAKPENGAWPPPVQDATGAMDAGTLAGVDEFIAYWNGQLANVTNQYRALADARSGEPALLKAAQDGLQTCCAKLCNAPPQDTVGYTNAVQDWTLARDKYNRAYKSLADKLDKLPDTNGATSLVEMYRSAQKAAADNAVKEYDALLGSFHSGPTTADAGTDTLPSDAIATARQKLEEAQRRLGTTISSDVLAALGKQDSALFAAIASNDGNNPQRVLNVIHQMYDAASRALATDDAATPAALSGHPLLD